MAMTSPNGYSRKSLLDYIVTHPNLNAAIISESSYDLVPTPKSGLEYDAQTFFERDFLAAIRHTKTATANGFYSCGGSDIVIPNGNPKEAYIL